VIRDRDPVSDISPLPVKLQTEKARAKLLRATIERNRSRTIVMKFVQDVFAWLKIRSRAVRRVKLWVVDFAPRYPQEGIAKEGQLLETVSPVALLPIIYVARIGPKRSAGIQSKYEENCWSFCHVEAKEKGIKKKKKRVVSPKRKRWSFRLPIWKG
jgi:hypothetical protein